MGFFSSLSGKREPEPAPEWLKWVVLVVLAAAGVVFALAVLPNLR